ncbi:hypothetical protein GOBAR_AA08617 [Gossypium barbadense]|uniref:Piwi domain-containing protein n=1 Tax=Gossypium barbadense TaxID=3634 RepID=A0A2P5Y8W9_GOSBA|nr:hypothetical protein GOBAR_AA08617 [Gossypium barbadense]
MLTLGQTPLIPVVSKVPTIILGMGALFGFPKQSDVSSIAAMEALLDFYTSSGKRKPDQIIISRDGQGSPDNVLHGTVIDNKVCHPKNNDFYLGTHAGIIGITRDALETSSSHGGMYAPGVISVPQLSKLKDKVRTSFLSAENH